MLTSQIKSISSQPSRSSTMYRRPTPSCSLSRQQTRNFRFGLWSADLHGHRERHRQLKQKSVEELVNYKKRYMQDKAAERSMWRIYGGRVLHDYSLHRPSRSCGKGVGISNDELLNWLPRALRGKRWGSSWRRDEKDHVEFTKKYKSQVYEYDPVSNRMVPRESESSSTNETNDFPRKVPISKGYSSQFSDFQPPSLNPDGSEAEPFLDPEFPPKGEELRAYKPYKYNEPDGKAPEDVAEPFIDPELPPRKEELKAYKPFKYNEPDGKSPELAAEENAPSKDELKGYKAFRYNEPDGKLPEELAPSDNITSKEEWEFYKAIFHPVSGELFRKLRSSKIEHVKGVIDPDFPLDPEKYKSPFKYNEPDGRAIEDLDPVYEPLEDGKPKSSNPKKFRANDSETSYIGTADHPVSAELFRKLRSSKIEHGQSVIDPDFPLDPQKYKSAVKYNEPDGRAIEEQDPVYEPLKDGKPNGSAAKLRVNDSETSYIGTADHPVSAELSQIRDGAVPKSDQAVIDPDFPLDAHKYKSPHKPKNLAEKLPVNDSETSYIGTADHPVSGQLSRIRDNSRKSDQAVLDPDFPLDAHNYESPCQYNEPDGHPPDISGFPDDAYKYQNPYEYNEPDGRAPEKTDTVVKAPKDQGTEYRPSTQEFEYVGDEEGVRNAYFLHILEEQGVDIDALELETNGFKDLRFSDFPKAKKEFDYQIGDVVKETLGRDALHIETARESRLTNASNFVESSANANETSSSDDFPDDAHKYGSAYTYNEPDGHGSKPLEDVDSFVKDLRDYSRPAKRETSETSSTAFIDDPKPTAKELRSYDAYKYHEPDGHAPQENEENAARRRELEDPKSYKPFRYNEPDGKASGKEDGALRKFEEGRLARDKVEDLDLLRTSDVRAASGISKSKNQRKETDADKESRRKALEADFIALSSSKTDLKNAIVTKMKNNPKTTESLRGVKKSLRELRRDFPEETNALRSTRSTSMPADTQIEEKKSLTGNFVRDFPEEFKTTWSTTGSTLVPIDAHAKENKVQREENAYVAGLASQEEYTRSGSDSDRIQTSLDRSRVSPATKIGNTNAEELYKLQAEIDPYSREPQGLETSYAQEIAQQGEGDLSLFVSSYGCGKQMNGKSESSSKDTDDELVKEVKEIYEDTYGTISPSHRQAALSDLDLGQEVVQTVATSDPSQSPTPPPTLYKILAFEPSTQSVKVAETTSITPDKSRPLTPAEVLMRLSNPAKFFPHFEPLRKEGYEIVSGGGDVLVFRRVRSGMGERAATQEMEGSGREHRRNPVDGMSPVKPATGNFASPTGFVNHDLPESSASSASSTTTTSDSSSSSSKTQGSEKVKKFKSNIDVRREEPVFSGRRDWSKFQDGFDQYERERNERLRKNKMGRGKRVMLGALGVGSGCYAVGVVAEWFRTGGVDGVGTGGRF